MTKQELMLLAITNPEVVRAAVVSDSQIELLKYIAANEVSAELIAAHYNIGRTNASARLATLFKQGYLKRRAVTLRFGLVQYWYSNTIIANKEN